jgi:hypothetical protein
VRSHAHHCVNCCLSFEVKITVTAKLQLICVDAMTILSLKFINCYLALLRAQHLIIHILIVYIACMSIHITQPSECTYPNCNFTVHVALKLHELYIANIIFRAFHAGILALTKHMPVFHRARDHAREYLD